MNLKTAITAYQGYASSSLTYAIQIWDNSVNPWEFKNVSVFFETIKESENCRPHYLRC